MPLSVGAGSPQVQLRTPRFITGNESQSKSTVVPPIFDIVSPVGAKQAAGGAHGARITEVGYTPITIKYKCQCSCIVC